jgi:NADH-quinone oxidoreductase subunit J
MFRKAEAGIQQCSGGRALVIYRICLSFELASVVLLVGIVAATALTLRGKRKSKSVSPSQQVFVKAKDRVRVLKMPAEKRDDRVR